MRIKNNNSKDFIRVKIAAPEAGLMYLDILSRKLIDTEGECVEIYLSQSEVKKLLKKKIKKGKTK